MFHDAMDRLFAALDAGEVPRVIQRPLQVALENSLKLFCAVGTPETGIARIPPGIYASDLLVKLIEAVKAYDWKTVSILLEQASSPVSRGAV
jgi:hypothetical protein